MKVEEYKPKNIPKLPILSEEDKDNDAQDDGLILFDDESEEEEFKNEEIIQTSSKNKFQELQEKYKNKTSEIVSHPVEKEDKAFNKQKENYIEKQKSHFRPSSKKNS